ncbi:MAG: hypothetical protein Alpg2KO_16560 [Alphaproteobacteria bacterium]
MSDGNVLQIDKTYDEAYALLVEARNYAAFQQKADAQGREGRSKLVISMESLRVTTRLTHVMSWLLMQKSYRAGEIGLDEWRADKNRLTGGTICEESPEYNHGLIPEKLGELLEHSHRLYMRVARLDNLLRSEDPAARPSLEQRLEQLDRPHLRVVSRD